MDQWTANDFMNRHLEHRLNVLKGFQNRDHEKTDRNAYSAMKDGAIITCRPLWELLGVTINSSDETTPEKPNIKPRFKKWLDTPIGIKINKFDETEFNKLNSRDDIILVLVAANKCVAHLDKYPDHGVTEQVLLNVIKITISEIENRVKYEI